MCEKRSCPRQKTSTCGCGRYGLLPKCCSLTYTDLHRRSRNWRLRDEPSFCRTISHVYFVADITSEGSLRTFPATPIYGPQRAVREGESMRNSEYVFTNLFVILQSHMRITRLEKLEVFYRATLVPPTTIFLSPLIIYNKQVTLSSRLTILNRVRYSLIGRR